MQGEHEHVALEHVEHAAEVADGEGRFQGEDLLIALIERGDDPHGRSRPEAATAEPATHLPRTAAGVRCQLRSVVRVWRTPWANA